METINEFNLNGQELIAVIETDGCKGCVGKDSEEICRQLPLCTEISRNDGRNIIWVDKPPARLTKSEIDDIKRRAIEQYGATWLHHFGSFVEAEVYARLGVGLPATAEGQQL